MIRAVPLHFFFLHIPSKSEKGEYAKQSKIRSRFELPSQFFRTSRRNSTSNGDDAYTIT